MDLTKILMNHGMTDWAGEPYNPEWVAHKISENYRQVDHLYVPDHIIIHLDTRKTYMTTYIPVIDFVARGQYANRPRDRK